MLWNQNEGRNGRGNFIEGYESHRGLILAFNEPWNWNDLQVIIETKNLDPSKDWTSRMWANPPGRVCDLNQAVEANPKRSGSLEL